MAVNRDREILTSAQESGPLSTLAAYFRLSGPGWLQSAITLGGGSLVGALYLGMLAGTSMLWLQLVAILVGVIMLSAIAYVTLSTKIRPYQAINQYVNPVLGVGWLTATILANMIWITGQYGLCYDALDQNLTSGLDDNVRNKVAVSACLGIAAFLVVLAGFRQDYLAKIFDWTLKLLVGMIVICFVAVVYFLTQDNSIDWNQVARGFIPNLNQWNEVAPEIQKLMDGTGEQNAYWKRQIISNQQYSMITVAATAVGLNMTFLLPYSLLARGWDKPFRGLARFDLVLGMMIPFVLVTTSIVIASAHAFHAKADENLLSQEPSTIQQSIMFDRVSSVIAKRMENRLQDQPEALEEFKKLEGEPRTTRIAEFVSQMSESERKLALTLVKPNSAQLAVTLEPVLGKNSNLIFGIGAFAMGFSTMVILMVINGYAFAEMFGNFQNMPLRAIGALAAGATGFCWIWLAGDSRTYLMVTVSTFAALLLPIAYICFMLLMNNSALLKKERPTGARMTVWNLLMAVGVIAAGLQAYGALLTKINDPKTGSYVLGGVLTFGLLALIGFSAVKRGESQN